MLLSTIVKSFKNVRVLCVGDVMLDHFLYGKVERISPEAPVPVFNFRSEKKMLGGAGGKAYARAVGRGRAGESRALRYNGR